MDFLFWMKKIVSPWCFPLTVILLLLWGGLLLVWRTARKRTGMILMASALSALTLLSYGLAPAVLLAPLESRHPPFDPQRVSPEIRQKLRWIVVLGGGHTSDPRLPVTGHLSEETAGRLLEAVRIHRDLPGGMLLVSGGPGRDSVSEAQVMSRVLQITGVTPDRIVLEPHSRDTEDQALFISRTIGTEPFVLVTSASHMPRAMVLFRRAGTDPIPAPAEHLVKTSRGMTPREFFPSAEHLRHVERAVYEYLGLLWLAVRGRL